MNRTTLWFRTIIILAITLLGIYLVFGPRHQPTGHDFTGAGIKENLSNNINLGLDLSGGSHLVMRVKTDDYLKTLTENNTQAAFSAAQDAKLPVTASATEVGNGNYVVKLEISDPSQAQAVVDEVKKKVDFVNWSQNTSGNTVTWSLPSNVQTVLKKQAVEQALKIIESRINSFGVKEPTLQRHGSDASGQILLQMPGVDDPERVKNLIGAESNLELAKIVGPANPSPVQTYPTEEAAKQSLGGTVPPNRRVLPLSDRDVDPDASKTDPASNPKQWVVIEYPAVVDGSELRDASATQGRAGGTDYEINFSLKPNGAQKFGDWTGKNINNYMGVVLNGEVKSAAFIKSQIFDSGQITGRFTKETADDLALTLRSGALPAKIEYQEERTVGPSLGADSIRAGVTASLAGLLFIVVFMLFYYRGAGVNAVIALVLNMILTMAALIMLDSTLTLPGSRG
jgi:preprotein translocase subunit SecD